MCTKWAEKELETLEEMAEMYTPEQIVFRLKRRGYQKQFAIRNSQLIKSDRSRFKGLSMLPEFKELV